MTQRRFQGDSEDYFLLFGPESSESPPGIPLSRSAPGARIFDVRLNPGENLPKIFGNFKVNQGWCHQPVLEFVWTGLRTNRCDTTYVSWGSVRNTLRCSSSSRSTTTASPLLHLRYYADTASSRFRQQQRFTTDDFDLGRVRVQLRPQVYEARSILELSPSAESEYLRQADRETHAVADC